MSSFAKKFYSKKEFENTKKIRWISSLLWAYKELYIENLLLLN